MWKYCDKVDACQSGQTLFELSKNNSSRMAGNAVSPRAYHESISKANDDTPADTRSLHGQIFLNPIYKDL
jgi:hypothetical protein